MENAEASAAASKLSQDEIEKVKAMHKEEMEKLNDSLKKHEAGLLQFHFFTITIIYV